MKRLLTIIVFLGQIFNCTIAQTLKLSAENPIVCIGSDVTLLAEYGTNVTTLTWEYSTDGRTYKTLKTALTKTLTTTVNSACVFRIRSGTATSNAVAITVATPYEPNWKAGGIPISSGYTIPVCDKTEDFYFSYDYEGTEKAHRERYTSTWTKNGVVIGNDFPCNVDLIDNTCKIVHTITDKYCPEPSVFEFNFEVTKLPVVDLAVSQPSICKGDEVTLTATAENASTVKWHKQYESESSNTVIKTTTGAGTTTYAPTQSGLYWLTVPSDGVCPEILSDMVRVEVNEPYEHPWEIIETHTQLQSGDELTYCGPQDYETFGFFNNMTVRDSIELVKYLKSEWLIDDVKKSDSYSFKTPPFNKNCKITNILTTAGCAPISFDFNIVVKELPEVTVEDVAVCDGNSATLTVNGNSSLKYQWYADEAHRQKLSSNASLSVSPKEETTYYLVANDGDCETEVEAKVKVGSIPTVVDQQEVNETTYLLNVEGGTGELQFDFGQGWQASNILTGAEPERIYQVMIKDELGCQTVYTLETKQYELEILEYLTPTSQPWLVGNLDKYKDIRVDIFDRNGRLLFSTTDPTEGWDGSYHGHNMPSTDYWYVITVGEKDEQYVGHFTLIR